jgi:hypothetical protein
MADMIMWSPGMTLEQIEKKIILRALEFYKKKTVTAEALGIAVRTLEYKLEKYEKDAEAEKAKAIVDEQAQKDRVDRFRGRRLKSGIEKCEHTAGCGCWETVSDNVLKPVQNPAP